MAKILKGAPAAAALTEALRAKTEDLRAAGVTPTLAIVRMGERPDDLSYEAGAMKRCEKAGVEVKRFLLPEDADRAALTAVIEHINAVPDIHGCLLFRPLPNRELEAAACEKLSPEKDADCMTAASLAGVFAGQGKGCPPCTAQACLELLDYYGVPIAGRRAVVIGRSLVIGKPAAMLLQDRDATVTMCHSKTEDLPGICREADILIAAAGKMGLVDRRFVRPGQVVVDVGIHTGPDGKLRGDVAFEDVEPIVEAITPVPGGVGAVTTAVLARHVVEAAVRASQGG